MRYGIVLILCFSLMSCATVSKEHECRISYVQLSVLYDYMIQTSPDAMALQTRYHDLKKKRDASAHNEDERTALEEQMDRLTAEIEKQKKALLTDMRKAVAVVAKRKGYAIVLGGGDTVVYAEDGHDITHEVLKELVVMRLQKSPAVR